MNKTYYDTIGNKIEVNDLIMIRKTLKGLVYHVAGKITSIQDDTITFTTIHAKGNPKLVGVVKIKPSYKVKANNNSIVKVEIKKAS